MSVSTGRPFRGDVTVTEVAKTDRLAVAGLLTAYAVVMAQTLGNPLTEYHAFRQTQTAFATRSFLQHGIDLLHPVVPVYGPSSQIPFEMPWYQALSSLVARGFGLTEVVALRTTSLAFTLITAIFIYALAKRLAGRGASFAATALFLFSPFTMQWGRAASIESFTMAMTLGWVCTVVRLRGERDIPGRYRILGACAGVLAATSKITTFLPWGIVALPAFVRDLRARRWQSAAAAASSGGVSILSGLAWTRHADLVKAADPYTAWLTSTRLQSFTFGTMQQRLTVSTWSTILSRSGRLVLGPLVVVVMGLAAVRIPRAANKVDLLAIASVPVAAFVSFTSLYFVHDYYQAAIVPAIAIPAGIAVAAIGRAILPGREALGILSLTTLGIAAALFSGSAYLNRTFEGAADNRSLSARAASITPSTEGVVVTGLGWSPEVLYDADRWGVMADGPSMTAASLLRRPFASRLTTVVTVHGFEPITREIFAEANWVAPVEKFAFKMSFGPQSHAPAPVPKAGVWPVVFKPGNIVGVEGKPMRLRCDGIIESIGSFAFSVDTPDPDAVLHGVGWTLPVVPGRFFVADQQIRCLSPTQKSIQVRIIANPSKQSVLP